MPNLPALHPLVLLSIPNVFSHSDGGTSFKLSLSQIFQQQRLHKDGNSLTKSSSVPKLPALHPLVFLQSPMCSPTDGSTSFKLSLSHSFQQQHLHKDGNSLTKSTQESLVNSQTCNLLEYGISADSTATSSPLTSSGLSGTNNSSTAASAAANGVDVNDGADATGVVVGPFSTPNLVVVGGSQTLSVRGSNQKACFWRNVETGGLQVLSDGSEHKC
ncbi:unnamed protein product [Closterium sp. NIES-54]